MGQKEHIFVQGAGDPYTVPADSWTRAYCKSQMSVIRAGTTHTTAWDTQANEYIVQLGGAYIALASMSRDVSPGATSCGDIGNYIMVNKGRATEYLGCASDFSRSLYSFDQSLMVGCVLTLNAGDRLSVVVASYNPEGCGNNVTISGFFDNFLSVTRLN